VKEEKVDLEGQGCGGWEEEGEDVTGTQIGRRACGTRGIATTRRRTMGTGRVGGRAPCIHELRDSLNAREGGRWPMKTAGCKNNGETEVRVEKCDFVLWMKASKGEKHL